MIKKLLFGSVSFFFLISPLFVSAQTTVSVQVQIDLLLKQIAQLQAQLTAMQNVPKIDLEVESTNWYLPNQIGSTGTSTSTPAPLRSVNVSFHGEFDIWPDLGMSSWVTEGQPYVNFGDGTADERAQKRVCPDAQGVANYGCFFEQSHTYLTDGIYTVTVYTLGQKVAGDDGRVGTKRILASKTISINALGISTTTNCPSFSRDLSVGSSDARTGGEVSKLQQYLIGAGVYPEALVTGYFGPATSRALQRWQTNHGIALTTQGIGMFGPKTRATIVQSCK